jgi:hypothetical protein
MGIVANKESLGLPLGMTGIALLPNHTDLGGKGELFLVSRQSNRVYALPLKDTPLLPRDIGQVVFTNVDMTAPPSTTIQADMRGITAAINRKHGWARLYVASRLPSVVLVYDLLRERPDSPLTMRLVATLPVGTEPAQLLYRHRPAPYPDSVVCGVFTARSCRCDRCRSDADDLPDPCGRETLFYGALRSARRDGQSQAACVCCELSQHADHDRRSQ